MENSEHERARADREGVGNESERGDGRVSANTEEQLLRGAIARLRASVMSLVFAVVGGTGLFVATAWLLIRAGSDVGRHLSLLDNYFPGYSVTWTGSLRSLAAGAQTASTDEIPLRTCVTARPGATMRCASESEFHRSKILWGEFFELLQRSIFRTRW